MKYLYILLLFSVNVFAQNVIYIEQIGSNNQFTISQDGTNHFVSIKAGLGGSSDTSNITIVQQGVGNKSAGVELPNGYSNTVSIIQDGNGSHTAGIQNFVGSANSISVTQNGTANNTFILASNSTNNANNITVNQSGNLGADKAFTLNLNGTNGATVNVQQTNSTTANAGSMSIQCLSLCGAYSYIRN